MSNVQWKAKTIKWGSRLFSYSKHCPQALLNFGFTNRPIVCPALTCNVIVPSDATVFLNWCTNFSTHAFNFQLHPFSKLSAISISHTRSWDPRQHVHKILATSAQLTFDPRDCDQKEVAGHRFLSPVILTTVRQVYFIKLADKAGSRTTCLCLVT